MEDDGQRIAHVSEVTLGRKEGRKGGKKGCPSMRAATERGVGRKVGRGRKEECGWRRGEEKERKVEEKKTKKRESGKGKRARRESVWNNGRC
jgi:hypothetical protein